MITFKSKFTDTRKLKEQIAQIMSFEINTIIHQEKEIQVKEQSIRFINEAYLIAEKEDAPC